MSWPGPNHDLLYSTGSILLSTRSAYQWSGWGGLQIYQDAHIVILHNIISMIWVEIRHMYNCEKNKIIHKLLVLTTEILVWSRRAVRHFTRPHVTRKDKLSELSPFIHLYNIVRDFNYSPLCWSGIGKYRNGSGVYVSDCLTVHLWIDVIFHPH